MNSGGYFGHAVDAITTDSAAFPTF
jgi:hypothetical protein